MRAKLCVFLDLRSGERRKRAVRVAALAASGMALGTHAPAFAAPILWTGATDTVWATGTNWVPNNPPTDDLTTDLASFNTNFTNAPNAGTRSVNGLLVGSGKTAAFTITSAASGGGLSLGGSGIDSTPSTVVTTLGAASTNQFTVAAPQTWTIGVNAQLTVAGTIAINNLVTLNGGGTTRFSVGNTGAGGITSNSGTLVINNAAGIGTGTLTFGGGSLNSTGLTLSTNNVQVWNGDFTFLATGALNLGTGAVTMNGNRQITVNGTTNALTVGGAISGGANSLTKAGTGQLTITNIANNFTGGLVIRAGLVEAQQASAGTTLGGGTVTLGDGSANATLQLQGGAASFNNPIVLGGSGTVLTISTRNSGTAVNLSGGITGTGNLTLNNGVANNAQPLNLLTGAVNHTGTLTNATAGSGVGGVAISAAIGGNVTGVVQNSGNGPLVLTGNNTYSGPTTITAGSLFANTAGPNSATGSSTVTVGTAGTLGGGGRVGGTVSVSTGGTVSPGSTATATGTLTIGGNGTALTFADNSTLRFQTAASPDLVNLTGTNSTVSFGPTWNLNITAASGDPTGQSFTLIDYTSTVAPTLPTTINFTGAYQGVVSIDSTNHAVVISNVSLVPEPGVAALFGIAGAALLARRRRTA